MSVVDSGAAPGGRRPLVDSAILHYSEPRRVRSRVAICSLWLESGQPSVERGSGICHRQDLQPAPVGSALREDAEPPSALSWYSSAGSRPDDPLRRRLSGLGVSSGRFNSALLGRVKGELVEIDGLLTGLAAAGPALEDRLHQQHGLRECQAGRRRKGFSRSRVRNPWAAVTSAVW